MSSKKSKWQQSPLYNHVRRYVGHGRRPGIILAALLVGATGYALLRPSSAAPQVEPPISTGYTSPVPQAVISPLSRQDLHQPDKKDLAMQLVSSAENSSLNWRAQFSYIEDIDDGRGYTAGLIGFCSGTGDMLDLIAYYTNLQPKNGLSRYLPALQRVNGSDSHDGLGKPFEQAWVQAAADPRFQQAQEHERDRVYFDPAVQQARVDGLSLLGQFMYYDAAVMHGPDAWGHGLLDIRKQAQKIAKTPADGGDETAYLNAFLDKREDEMRKDPDHRDLSRVETEQRKFLLDKNFDLNLPLTWRVYNDRFSITE